MSDKIILSQENVTTILRALSTELRSMISKKDLSTPYLDEFTKLGLIKTDGTGNAFLVNNGEYFTIDTSKIPLTKGKLEDIYEVLNIGKETVNQITDLPPLSAYTVYTQPIPIGDKIYLLGKSTVVYNTKTETYEIKDTLTTSNISNGYSAEYYEGNIYTFGSNFALAYNPTTDTVETKKLKPNPCYKATNQLVGNLIYIIGGYNSDTDYATNEVYNCDTNTWETKKDMTNRRFETVSEYKDGNIYVIGGTDKDNIYRKENDCYNISTNTWSYKTSMDSDFTRGMGSFLYDDKIYTFGGYNSDALCTDTIYTYSVTDDKWELIDTKLKSQIYAFSYCIIDNKAYIFGGYCPATKLSTFASYCYEFYKMIYDISLPEDVQSKVDILKIDGDGTKVLLDNGEYLTPEVVITPMSSDDITNMINTL